MTVDEKENIFISCWTCRQMLSKQKNISKEEKETKMEVVLNVVKLFFTSIS
jgi:hypothetical protein